MMTWGNLIRSVTDEDLAFILQLFQIKAIGQNTVLSTDLLEVLLQEDCGIEWRD